MRKIVWAFKPRPSPLPVLHFFLVLPPTHSASVLAGCGWRRPANEKLAVATLLDRRLLDGAIRLCANCARVIKRDPAYVGQKIVTVEHNNVVDWLNPS